MKPYLLSSALAFAVVAAGACSQKAPEGDCLEALPLQNPRAHAVGDTYYLPASTCRTTTAWTLAEAPPGSANRVYTTGTANPRFTPDVPGRYVFALADSAAQTTLVAEAAPARDRFRNHYLTPLYGAARVGDELWTANGASYTVSRLAIEGGALRKTGELAVGSWPAAIAWRAPLPYAVVAQRGADTVGFVDRARGVLEDALWVGDEPSGLAIAPDARRLYVSLATERAVAVVDLETRTVVGRIAVGFDPRALAISEDGAKLYVASYRSGNADYGPGGTRPDEDKDVFVVDTARMEVVGTVNAVAADLRAMTIVGDELFVAATDGETLVSQADPKAKPFQHIVSVIDVAGGRVARTADLTRQPSSHGPMVNPAGVLVDGDAVWVAAESSSEVAVLDRATLAERTRVQVGKGPRQMVALGGGAVAVHCFQSFDVWVLEADGRVRQTVRVADDPRPEDVALGEEIFTRPGGKFAANHACSSCHVETQNDGMIWNFGPKIWHNVRPLQLLDATTPIEWGAYVSSTANFGFQGPQSIIARPVSTREAAGLGAFLGSLIGAPRATGHTRLDGSFSPDGLRGKALFEGRATCSGCHAPPLYTTRAVVPVGKSGEPADVPSLLGAYRHGVYFVKGQSRSLERAVDVAAEYVKVPLDATDRASLVRFLQELTPKGAAPLGVFPDIDSNEGVPATVRPYIGFAEPVDDTERPAEVIAGEHVRLETEGGGPVKGSVTVTGRTLTFVPEAPLAPGRYRFVVTAGLPFRTGGVLEGDRASSFRVGAPATAVIEGNVQLVVQTARGAATIPARVEGSQLVVTLGPEQEQRLWMHTDGDAITLQSFAIPLGPAMADASSVRGKLTGPGRAQGTLVVGAPGLSLKDVPWEIRPAE